MQPFVLKEKCLYKFQITFRVQHEIVSNLQFVNKVSRSKINVSTEKTTLGSYAPGGGEQVVTMPRNQWDEAPSGMMMRATYSAQASFIDQDKNTHANFPFKFKIAKSWK